MYHSDLKVEGSETRTQSSGMRAPRLLLVRYYLKLQKRVFSVRKKSHFTDLISASFALRDIALISSSRFKAILRVAWISWYTMLTGRRLRV